MQYEYVFNISGGVAQILEQTNLASAGFLERKHLEEWLIANPQILGEDALVVTSEFGRWQTWSGVSRRDRLDILAIDSGGQLIVAELKRDLADSEVDLQALKYAALVSRFDDATLVQAYQEFVSLRTGSPVSDETARAALEGHVDGPLDSETWAQPRIVLVANSFPETVTNTVLWLSEAGLDITLLRYQLYSTGADPLLVVSQIYPVPDTQEFLLSPRRQEIQKVKERAGAHQRATDVVKVLVAAGIPEPGTPLHLEPVGVRSDLREQITAWIEEDPTRGQAEWTGDALAPVRWLHTGLAGKPSTFATEILESATGLRRSLAGPQWWRLEDGTSLARLSAQVRGSATGLRDWSDLHGILESLPTGRWTTYGDLAALIGTAAQPLGQHLAICPDCPNAHRVLLASGRLSPDFQWSDPLETRTAQQILESEGVRFNADGIADPKERMTSKQLAGLDPTQQKT